MNRERMTILRDHLRDNVKDDKFNLSTWVGNDEIPWGGMQDLSCGTTACAMGHAASIPSFQEQGLRLERFHDRFNEKLGRITFNGKVDFDAAGAFMDLNSEETEWVFDPARYRNENETTRMEVVERLTSLLESPEETHYGVEDYSSSDDEEFTYDDP